MEKAPGHRAIGLMLTLGNTLDTTQEGTHRKAPRKMKVKSRKLNVKGSMDKAMVMRDHPNATRKLLWQLWLKSAVAALCTLRGCRMWRWPPDTIMRVVTKSRQI